MIIYSVQYSEQTGYYVETKDATGATTGVDASGVYWLVDGQKFPKSEWSETESGAVKIWSDAGMQAAQDMRALADQIEDIARNRTPVIPDKILKPSVESYGP